MNKIGKEQDTDAIEEFGFPTTTCCGYLAQNNEWHNDWVVSVAMKIHTSNNEQMMFPLNISYANIRLENRY